jgi:hypothetical protein
MPAAAAGAGLRLRDAWRALRGACVPFRAGTRFRALPDVAFWRDGARVRAPGDALPGAGDPTLATYRARLADGAFALRVDEPLLADSVLWQAARALLRAALGPDAAPVLPVAATLGLRSGMAAPWRRPTGHVQLIAVLDGALPAAGDTPALAAGDALWLPAGAIAPDDDSALLLTFTVATDPATIATAVDEATEALLLRLLEREHPDDGAVTMAPDPPRCGARGLPPSPSLRALSRALAAPSLHAALADALDLDACLRTSSLGLLPVPPRRSPPLRDDERLRLRDDGVLRRTLPDGRWLLAVNGHAQVFEADAPARRAWSRLCAGGHWPVATLIGPGRGREALRERLQTLHALGALERETERTS